ncbi:MAG: hypothetical protein HRT47_02875 [Candidatus Caenarcaniphilales bacterium]|nr:hypothetical protein [Candidatus Caenarcaniphilales bacterium]
MPAFTSTLWGAALAARISAKKPDFVNSYIINPKNNNELVADEAEGKKMIEVFHRAPDLFYEKVSECDMSENNEIKFINSKDLNSSICVDYFRFWSQGTKLIIEDLFKRSQADLEEVYPKLKEIFEDIRINIHFVDSLVFALHELAQNVGNAHKYNYFQNIALIARDQNLNSIFLRDENGSYNIYIQPSDLDLLRKKKLSQESIDLIHFSIESELLKNYASILAERKSGFSIQKSDARMMNAVINLEMLNALEEKYNSNNLNSNFARIMKRKLHKIKSKALKELNQQIHFESEIRRAMQYSKRERLLKVFNRGDIKEI